MSLSDPFFLDKSDAESWKALNAFSLKVKAAGAASGLDFGLIELLNVRISQINGCAFCLDMHVRQRRADGPHAAGVRRTYSRLTGNTEGADRY